MSDLLWLNHTLQIFKDIYNVTKHTVLKHDNSLVIFKDFLLNIFHFPIKILKLTLKNLAILLNFLLSNI